MADSLCCTYLIDRFPQLLQQYPLTCALKGFFSSVQTCLLVDVSQLLPWFFTHWSRKDSFPVSRALERICRCLSLFCNILLYDLTPLHVKIMRNTMCECLSKETQINLSTYLNTVSYNHILRFLNKRLQFV